jgi:GTPase SAR1 family protein
MNASPETRKLKIMLHGPPGTGKTTLITSIAKETNGMLIMAKISKFKTIDSLRNFVFADSYDSYNYVNRKYCLAKPKTKIIVFEDVDADIGDIIKKRKSVADAPTKTQEINALEKVAEALTKSIEKNDKKDETKDDKSSSSSSSKSDKINLSDLLNLFDGILQLQNVIVVFTTNCIDEIDPAFYRPGRINVCEYMGYLNHDEFINYATRTYPDSSPADIIKGDHDKQFKISELTAATAASTSFDEFCKLLAVV